MFTYHPWNRFGPYLNRRALDGFLDNVGKTTERKLYRGIMGPPKTGRVYGRHQASASGEYPANDTGRLARSIRRLRSPWQITVGTTAPYGGFLADGTRRGLKPRKMSKEAMQEAIPEARQRMAPFLQWRRL